MKGANSIQPIKEEMQSMLQTCHETGCHERWQVFCMQMYIRGRTRSRMSVCMQRRRSAPP